MSTGSQAILGECYSWQLQESGLRLETACETTDLALDRTLERDLRTALRENQLGLVYQPQIDLITGDVIGVEGLTRWNHPTRGPVPPSQFIPVAEQSELIEEIFRNSLHRMLKDAARWRSAGLVVPTLSVHASAGNLRNDGFVSMVKRELEDNSLAYSQLDIEVTESLLQENESLFIERLRALRTIGVKVSLDGFGTRYTESRSLNGLSLNTVKIDRSCVHDVDRSSHAQSLCRSAMTMARYLKLGTIAEGIESAAELRTLKELGCQAGQGFLFQRPVPSERFTEFLLDWPEQKKRPAFDDAFTDVGSAYDADPLYGMI
jgi:EAL domain-containing protein (putative c-di-GMP-specific phosphodiesterase class I)